MNSIVEINDADFEGEVLKAQQPVLVYFWASWCGPCRLVAPTIDWAANTYGERLKVVKLEVGPNPDTVQACKIEGVPALRIFKNKELIHSFEGAIGKEQLQILLDDYLK